MISSDLDFIPHLYSMLQMSTFFFFFNVSAWLWDVKNGLCLEDAKKLMDAFISSRLGYCNALLPKLYWSLTKTSVSYHFSPISAAFHWLSVSPSTCFKTLHVLTTPSDLLSHNGLGQKILSPFLCPPSCLVRSVLSSLTAAACQKL